MISRLPKLDLIKTYLLSNGYPANVTESVINKKHRKQKYSNNKPACMVPIPYIKRPSEKFEKLGIDSIESVQNKTKQKFRVKRQTTVCIWNTLQMCYRI
jgi:hypothetical protein